MCRITLLLLFMTYATLAQNREPVRHTLRFPAPQTHYVEVESVVSAAGGRVEVLMPVWTPGSYLVREYSGHVEDFRAASPDGKPLRVERTRKNRWAMETGGARSVVLRYKVYAHVPTVQGNWVDAGFAMLNGAANFTTPVEQGARPHEVRVELPAAWQRSISGMRNGPGGANHWLAADFDELVDSPIYAGSAPVHEFEVQGKRHYLVNEGEGPMWDGPASAREVQKVVAEFARMWGGLPYEKYVFFNMLIEQGGGLEHRNSVWMNASKWNWSRTQTPPGEGRRGSRQSWLGLASHEFFHAWNVKRLRPVELGPFDYENENYTRGLWEAEGFTSYYGPLGLRRAGITTVAEYLQSLGDTIAQLQETPGRLVQPVEESSYDAWIKFYRRDENSSNTGISYYTKGAVIAFLLDAKVRRATAGAKSLDDVMRLAYQRYSGGRGFTAAEFRATAQAVAGTDFGAWFTRVLETTSELDYGEALDWFGLRFAERAGAGRGASRAPFGLTAKNDNGRLIVSEVRRAAPGYAAGVNVDDEILAVNGYRVRADQWPARLDAYKPGETVTLTLARREKLLELPLKLEREPQRSWTLEIAPGGSTEQQARRKAWLSE